MMRSLLQAHRAQLVSFVADEASALVSSRMTQPLLWSPPMDSSPTRPPPMRPPFANLRVGSAETAQPSPHEPTQLGPARGLTDPAL